MNDLFILVLSLLIFELFRSIDIPNNKLINTFASAAFGVYLIHDDKNISQVLQTYVFGRLDVGNKYLIVYSLAVIIILYLVCTAVELLRIGIIENSYIVYVYLFENKAVQLLKSSFLKIKKIINRFFS